RSESSVRKANECRSMGSGNQRWDDRAMHSETRDYRTGGADRVLALTSDCAEFVSGRGDGLLHLFVPHATAGLAILETVAGSDDDLLAALRDLLPGDDRWRPRHG